MKTSRFLAVQALCGTVAGWLAALILTAIAAPIYSNYLTTHEMAASFSRLEPLVMFIGNYRVLWPILAWSALIVSMYWTARMINPHLPDFPHWRVPKPSLAVVALGGGVILLYLGSVMIVSSTANMGLLSFEKMRAWPVLLGLLGCATGWFMLSPGGLAGDLTTWATVSRDKIHRHVRALLAGGLFGVTVCVAAILLNGVFNFFFVLIVDVWTYSAEPSFSGYIRLIVCLCLLGTAVSLLVFSAVPALACEDPDPRVRLKKAAPLIGTAATAALVFACFYSIAVSSNDWRAGGLAEAAGLDKGRPAAMTMVYFGHKPGKSLELVQWSMETRYDGIGGSGKVLATEANASRLLKFLSTKGRSSRYRWGAVDVLPKIFAMRWEIESVVDVYEEMASVMGPEYGSPLIHLISSLEFLTRSARVTDANRKRLSAFSDHKRYRIPAKPALYMARGWRRFGDEEKAGRWLKYAREKNASEKDIKEVLEESGRGLMDGKVSGRVKVAGADEKTRIKVGLFVWSEYAPFPGDSLFPRLAASQWTSPGGSFEFTDLTGGRYALAVLVPESILSHDTKGVVAAAHPGVIELSPKKPAFAAGTITIETGR